MQAMSEDSQVKVCPYLESRDSRRNQSLDQSERADSWAIRPAGDGADGDPEFDVEVTFQGPVNATAYSDQCAIFPRRPVAPNYTTTFGETSSSPQSRPLQQRHFSCPNCRSNLVWTMAEGNQEISLRSDPPSALSRTLSNGSRPHENSYPALVRSASDNSTQARVAVTGVSLKKSLEEHSVQRMTDFLASKGNTKVTDGRWHRDQDEPVFIATLQNAQGIANLLSLPYKRIFNCPVSFRVIEPEISVTGPNQVFYAKWGKKSLQKDEEKDEENEEEPSSDATSNSSDDGTDDEHQGIELCCALNNQFGKAGIQLQYDRSLTHVVVVVPPEAIDEAEHSRHNDGSIIVQSEDGPFILYPLLPVLFSNLVDGRAERDVILVYRLPKNSRKELLKNYFNATRPVDRIIKLDSCCALVIFEKGQAENADRAFDEAYDDLRKLVYRQPFKGRMLGVQRIPESKTLRVRLVDVPELDDTDLLEELERHFSARVAGEIDGGNVVKVLADSQHVFLVTFHDRTVLNKACEVENSDKVWEHFQLRMEIQYDSSRQFSCMLHS